MNLRTFLPLFIASEYATKGQPRYNPKKKIMKNKSKILCLVAP